jgi:hypothetical protein
VIVDCRDRRSHSLYAWSADGLLLTITTVLPERYDHAARVIEALERSGRRQSRRCGQTSISTTSSIYVFSNGGRGTPAAR